MRTETLELKALEHTTDADSWPTSTSDSEEEDEFPHGWRYVKIRLPDGSKSYKQVPLTAADFLDPQLGDVMPQDLKHQLCTFDIFNGLRNRYSNDPTVAVVSDLKIQWGIRKLKGPAPDICVIPNVKEKEPNIGTFKVKAQGTRPCLVIEVMSPNYPGDDTEKVKIYERAGVAEYIIVNPYQAHQELSYSLIGYRLVAGKYQRLKPDAQGRLLSQTTGVLFGVAADQLSVILWDAVSGEKLLTAVEEQQAHRASQAQVQVEIQARQEAEVKA